MSDGSPGLFISSGGTPLVPHPRRRTCSGACEAHSTIGSSSSSSATAAHSPSRALSADQLQSWRDKLHDRPSSISELRGQATGDVDEVNPLTPTSAAIATLDSLSSRCFTPSPGGSLSCWSASRKSPATPRSSTDFVDSSDEESEASSCRRPPPRSQPRAMLSRVMNF